TTAHSASSSMLLFRPRRTLRLRLVSAQRRDATRIPPHTASAGRSHTFASDVLDAGSAIDEVQALLGHRSVVSTQVYLKSPRNAPGQRSNASPHTGSTGTAAPPGAKPKPCSTSATPGYASARSRSRSGSAPSPPTSRPAAEPVH